MGGPGQAPLCFMKPQQVSFVLFPNNCHQGRAANFRGHMLRSLVVSAAPTWPSSQLLQV